MKIKESKSNDAKIFEEKRKEINELIGLNNITIKENISLTINARCKEQIKILHKEYPNTEWLAVCKVEPKGKGQFVLTDMLFPQQRGIGGECETTKEGMNWLTRELIRRGEKQTDWNCIMHSHHHMGVFRSGTDDNARLGLNDGRKMEWAVVTAYKGDEISYKGCLNFYKPYNIEIDVNVVDTDEETIVDKYMEYSELVAETQARRYDFLLEVNEDKIDELTDKPSYSDIVSYLGLDISTELEKNYKKIKDKIGNPELLEYLKWLEDKAEALAIEEVERSGLYTDVAIEYDVFCEWSEALLTQLKEHREAKEAQRPKIYSSSLYSSRDFEDDIDEYYYTSPAFDANYIKTTFGICDDTPIKVGSKGEWRVWSSMVSDYLYVEDWANEVVDYCL